jgi:DNA invertase Pin-like site-specific DNA recombinase
VRALRLGEHSGFKIDQSPVMAQILQEAEERQFDALVCRDGARLGRDYWEKMGTIRDLRRAGVELHVLEDGGFFDYEDSMNKVKSFANSWGDEGKKLEEIRKSMKATEAIRSAHFPTTSLPFGYEPAVDPVSRRKVWRPTPEAAIVRSVFQAIVEEPYEEFSALSRRHGVSRQLLRKILRNRAYTGGFNWKGSFVKAEPHVIPPLVDEAQFDEVQRILGRREMTQRIRSPDLMNVLMGFQRTT